MAEYKYQVVPFIGKLQSGESAGKVSEQLQVLIEKHASQGWEFSQLQDVNIEVQPGCLAALFGAKASYILFDQVIFRKPMA